MKFEEHCLESERLFGKPFSEIHRWLDEFAGKPGIGMRHRCYRHHLAGVNEAVKIFGEDIRAAAIMHIKSDLAEEGWTEKDPFPKDYADYVMLGFY